VLRHGDFAGIPRPVLFPVSCPLTHLSIHLQTAAGNFRVSALSFNLRAHHCNQEGLQITPQCLICFWLITCPATTTDFLLESMRNPRHGNMQSSLANINHGIFHHFPIFSTTASLLQQYRGFANIPCLAV